MSVIMLYPVTYNEYVTICPTFLQSECQTFTSLRVPKNAQCPQFYKHALACIKLGLLSIYIFRKDPSADEAENLKNVMA